MSVQGTRGARAAAQPGSAAAFLFRTCEFTCRPDAATACEEALEAMIAHADRNEPGTRFVASFRDADDPYHFLVTSVFEDEEAERIHDSSPPSRRWLTVLRVAADGLRMQSWEAGAGL